MRNVSGDVYCRQACPFESVYAFMEIQSFNGAKESEENKQTNKQAKQEKKKMAYRPLETRRVNMAP